MLYINLLGTPKLYLDDDLPLRFRTRKAQALLIYLAVTGRSWTRNALATLFWPETNDAIALKNLRDILPPLRRQLGDYLLLDGEVIGVAASKHYFCDVTAFSTVLERQLQGIETRILAETLALYHGEFLEGYTSARISADFELWALRERQRLHQMALMGFSTLCRRQQESGAYEAALTTNRQLLKLAPWDEAAHRRQMILLAQSNQLTAALAHFETCRQILADELDAEPEAETVQLLEQIKGGQHWTQSPHGVDDRSQRTAEAPPLLHNLPHQLTSLIGREADIDAAVTVLNDEHKVLLTVVGEGGIGKTCLALAVAQLFVDEAQARSAPRTAAPHRQRTFPFPDGIGYVSLGSLTPTEMLEDQLATATANALYLQLSGTESLRQQIQDRLRHKAILLVFDNVEHLLPQAADFFLALLQHAPRLKIMATSRHLLNLQAESIIRLAGLPTPHPQDASTLTLAALLDYSSVALFVDRARRVNHMFQITATNQAALVQICYMVHGLPLAIELAATQTRNYTCQQILRALQKSYTVLSSTLRDLAPRHRSIHAMLSYSWQFLSPERAQLLAACSIFRGTFDSAVVTEIMGANAELLFSLVDQSLLQLLPSDESANYPRFAMHELIRQYAATRLQTQPAEMHRLHTAHAHYYLTLLSEQSRIFVHDLAALQRMQGEIVNLRAAWEWSCTEGQWELLAIGASPMREFYDLVSLFHEAERYFSHAIAQVQHLSTQRVASSTTHEQLVAKLLAHQCHFCERLDQIAKAEELAQSALAISQRLDDHAVQSSVYLTRSTLYGRRADWTSAQHAAEQALAHARAAALSKLESCSLQNIGCTYLYRGDIDQALDYLHRSLALYRSLATTTGSRHYHTEGLLYLDLGFAYQVAGDLMQARAYYQQSVELYHQMSIPILGVYALSYLSEIHLRLGSFRQASADAQMALVICRPLGSRTAESTVLGNLAYAHYLLGDWGKADDLCQVLFDLIRPLGLTLIRPFVYFMQGELRRSQGKWQAALAAYEMAQQEYSATEQTAQAISTQFKLAKLWLQMDDLPKAMAQIEARLSYLRQPVQNSWLETAADYWICYEVLAATHDPRATDLLQQGIHYIQGQAKYITDQTLRHSYLNNIPANRALLALATQVGLH